jgi:ketosteroid isomerase-like protein
MSEPTPALAAEIETVKEIYAAINRNDVSAALNYFDANIEWIEPSYYPGGGGTYRGHADVRAKISDGRNTWAEGSCHLEGFIVAGDKIVVFVHAHVRLRDHTECMGGRFADVWTFRNGKAIQGRSFGERQEALEWAGAKAPDATSR